MNHDGVTYQEAICGPDGPMTMRDVFAAFAPEPPERWIGLKLRSDHERMLADPNRRYQEKGEVHWRVVWTWQWADAMLAEREKGA